MSSQRASARAAIATIGHALAAQSEPVVFVGGTVTALDAFVRGQADAAADDFQHFIGPLASFDGAPPI